MAYLKFNKAELVNLDYSLRREILGSNRFGAFCNTSIICCNTRKYHGLLVAPLENFSNERFVMLSSVEESLVMNGKHFNLGITCYGDVYEPKGHKYIIDFDADHTPVITYKVGPVLFTKSIALAPDKNQVMLKYSLVSAPGKVSLNLKPFLAFRSVHGLTAENPVADSSATEISNGEAFCLYEGFPSLNLQTNVKAEYRHQPYWYKGVTYSDEYRRGYDCTEDLLVPGTFLLDMKQGDEIVFSASLSQENPRTLKKAFDTAAAEVINIGSHEDLLSRNAKRLKVLVDGKKMICAGYSWLVSGLLRETVLSLPGLTLYAGSGAEEFEEILDNLIGREGERLYRKTTQIEAPLCIVDCLQQYIAFGADPEKVWKKYSKVLKGIVESYAHRDEVTLCPNGLLWTQKENTALSWMNTYIDGHPVNERAGYQVETNALWYNALCFTIEMEERYGSKKSDFAATWTGIRDLVKESFQPTFIMSSRGYHTLADFVDANGQHGECRPNMLYAVYIPYDLLDDEVKSDVIYHINNELVTRRGIRTLSPRCPWYKGSYNGTQRQRDEAYHNGCTHTALLGPYIDLCFRMIGPSFCGKAKWLTEGFFEDVNMHGVGAFSELYDGDPPHEPHGAISSATATAALMRCMYLMNKYSKEDVK